MNHNSILQEDLDSVLKVEFIDWNAFAHKTFFITGATGLIGSMLIRSLNYANIKKNLEMKIKLAFLEICGWSQEDCTWKEFLHENQDNFEEYREWYLTCCA